MINSAESVADIQLVWLILAALLVFFMRAGFMALEAGLTQRKHNINVAAKNLADFGIVVILFWLFGFGLMFGEDSSTGGLIGTNFLYLDFLNSTEASTTDLFSITSFFLFQVMCCGIAVTIVSGATAERIRFESYLIIVIVISSVIYPIFGHWAWGGFIQGARSGLLSQIGFVDFAGATVVHSIGGWCALTTVFMLGPRRGSFYADGNPRPVGRANLPLAVLGMLVIWFGWFGFNSGISFLTGDNLELIIVNTLLAGAAGLVAIIPICVFFNDGIIEVNYLINGALAGLVAISAGCHAVAPQHSIWIGFISAWVMFTINWLLSKMKQDDPVGTISAHLGGGIWGTLAVALFGVPEILGTGLTWQMQIFVQLIGITVAGTWSLFVILIFLTVLRPILPLRVDVNDETIGLNITEQRAIPDFSEFPGLEEALRPHYEQLLARYIRTQPQKSTQNSPDSQ
ncbi:MAG: ammonium transporter [Chloroflexota bacterium]